MVGRFASHRMLERVIQEPFIPDRKLAFGELNEPVPL